MRRLLLALLLAALACPAMAAPRLIWSDEFDGDRLDPAKWTAATDCWGGGNDERQCYAPANVTVSGGVLRLNARKERASGPARRDGGPRVTRDYASGGVSTKGLASFRYGRIDVRAKLPLGQGLWPAIWMLPEHDNYGPYPLSGEIDIAEAVNLGVRCRSCRDRVRAAVHHGPTLQANRSDSADAALGDLTAFHVFALEWTPNRLTWLLDGKPYFTRAGGRPFDERFHLILNLAVGGRWAETTGRRGVDDAALPESLLVDWVRVYAPED
ncbi:glycoside hydrolase family 16 protein [Caulobacter radicis]|uniref:glycoside hydrolase family 16 protein n=1 Tax=Caulobacter radicis TaxID=2172650 RepID=UPI001FCBC08F|nr:glycoside hydrolase family 16 protein [Caulobacter radicis]